MEESRRLLARITSNIISREKITSIMFMIRKESLRQSIVRNSTKSELRILLKMCFSSDVKYITTACENY
jgi:hypothetical protein